MITFKANVNKFQKPAIEEFVRDFDPNLSWEVWKAGRTVRLGTSYTRPNGVKVWKAFTVNSHGTIG